MYKLKILLGRIKNLIRWFPVIWKDQDWDQFYIYEILKFKLKNQATYIGSRNRYVGASRDAQIIRTCVKLIEKLQQEYYNSEYLDYEVSDFDFIESVEYPGQFEMKYTEFMENYDAYFRKYPLIYRTVPDLKAPKRVIAFQIAKINEQRAHDLLFKILKENINRWWD